MKQLWRKRRRLKKVRAILQAGFLFLAGMDQEARRLTHLARGPVMQADLAKNRAVPKLHTNPLSKQLAHRYHTHEVLFMLLLKRVCPPLHLAALQILDKKRVFEASSLSDASVPALLQRVLFLLPVFPLLALPFTLASRLKHSFKMGITTKRAYPRNLTLTEPVTQRDLRPRHLPRMIVTPMPTRIW